MLGLGFDFSVCRQSCAINFQRVVEIHLAASALNRQLPLCNLSVFFLFIAQAKFGNRKNIRLETFANEFAANTNPQEIHTAGNVANQVGVGSFLPEFEFLGIGFCYCLHAFHANNIQYQYQICKLQNQNTY
jgi:hypothetical protein